ncbi:hypothetical protein PUN28_002765 [Cardiocondyla obscurior]|uniref:Uncharacterized protein n=1 Tax=Cardiocondyla obscurior TaxID=286306 RepID=A0AAW2GVY1_9HYME
MMVLDAVRELVLGLRHVVDRVAVVMVMFVVVQIVVLAEMVDRIFTRPRSPQSFWSIEILLFMGKRLLLEKAILLYKLVLIVEEKK